jgi:hypothetical protein
MRADILYARMLENTKKFDPQQFGMVKLFEWGVESAQKYGFCSPGKFLGFIVI